MRTKDWLENIFNEKLMEVKVYEYIIMYFTYSNVALLPLTFLKALNQLFFPSRLSLSFELSAVSFLERERIFEVYIIKLSLSSYII